MNGQTLMLPIRTRTFTANNVKVHVPYVNGGTTAAAQEKMNGEIAAATQRLMKDQGFPGEDIRQMDGTYEIKTNERGVLSLSLLNYTFTGGAHGNTLQRSLTFDADTGRSYKLGELFKPNVDYKARINRIIEAQIQSRRLPLLDSYPGIGDDQEYYIADKALVVYFPLYELVPYAWGFPYFPISVYEIQDIIDEDGPLGAMMY
ncbi:DUF3298 and DUF4163 domain-containing protein [Cohnella hongkongensis]|uniref:DUF3298 and DUF4163 domain-containing protein n=1 Tax=Cohnella hongkongensis TaxID=178337 RepID=A0ABV9FGA7_9BACL